MSIDELDTENLGLWEGGGDRYGEMRSCRRRFNFLFSLEEGWILDVDIAGAGALDLVWGIDLQILEQRRRWQHAERGEQE